MSRDKVTEVICDYCGNAMLHVMSINQGEVTKQLRRAKCIVSKDGDFCGKDCFAQYQEKEVEVDR